jgi:hypothetical protein
MSTLVVKRIWIEQSECTGHTLCVPEAPDLIEFDQADGTSAVNKARSALPSKNLLGFSPHLRSARCALSALRPKMAAFTAFRTIGQSETRLSRETSVGQPQ